MTRSIGIFGPYYCGSTFMGRVLGGLPDVAFAGESHWLLNPRTGKWEITCECGEGSRCPWHGKRPWLAHRFARTHRWWDALAELLETDVVVSSDKSPGTYDVLGPPDIGLMLIRDPRGWVVSMHNHLVVEETNISDAFIVSACQQWIGRQEEDRQWLRFHGVPFVEVAIPGLVALPEIELRKLCTALGLQYDPAALWIDKSQHHALGGNVPRWDRPRFDDRFREVLTADQERHILDRCEWTP